MGFATFLWGFKWKISDFDFIRWEMRRFVRRIVANKYGTSMAA